MRPSEQFANPHWRSNSAPDHAIEGRRAFESLKEEVSSSGLGGPRAYVRERVGSEEHHETLSAPDLRLLLRGFRTAVREDIKGRVRS